MLAFRKTAPVFGAQLDEVPEPAADGTSVLVEVEAAGICGSDIHMYEWTAGYDWLIPSLPVAMGHEFCGRVVAVGADVVDIAVGQRVVVVPGYSCLTCGDCMAGRFDTCRSRKTTGLSMDGAFAPLVRVPARTCLPISEDLPGEIAAMTEPLCVSERAVSFGNVQLGDDVVVLGPGVIGLGVAYLAMRRVTVIGKSDPLRLGIAEKLGAERIIDLADYEGRSLSDIIGGRGADVVFEATGAADSITQGLDLLRDYGMMVAIGIHHEPSPIDTTPFVRRKLQMRGAHGSGRDNWDRVMALMPSAISDLAPLVTHQIGLEQVVEGFEMCRRREACKVILRPQQG